MDEIAFKVIGKINETIQVPHNIDINCEIKSLGINSMNFIRIIVSIEDEFDFEFEDEYLDMSGFNTIKNLCEYVANKI
jgi:acyl carrier protein